MIAAEIRELAGDSRTAIEEVSSFLTRTAEDIRESAAISEQSAAGVRQVETLSRNTGNSLGEIVAQIESIAQGMVEFQRIFSEQERAIDVTISESEDVHRMVEGIGRDIDENARGYEKLRGEVVRAAEGARSAAHSARVLSQLGTYLRTGGQEMSHVVETVEVSEARHLAGLKRKERRTSMLYNLEVLVEDEVIGHLGDISPSGLMLYSPRELTVGTPVDAAIRLPLNQDQKEQVPIRFVPRRNEKQSWFFRVGCSLDEESARQQKDDIAFIITSFTVTQGIEDVAAPSATPGTAQAFDAATPTVPGGQSDTHTVEDEDIQGLEELEEFDEADR